jgi:hypothetical protein
MKPFLPPAALAAPEMGPAVPFGPRLPAETQEVSATLDAFLATGADGPEAWVLTAQVHGVALVLPLLSQELAHAGSDRAVAFLKDVGGLDPALAQAGLTAWLEALGFRVTEALPLRQCKWVTTLPAHLRVRDALDLAHSGVTDLPADLQVGGKLFLSGTAIATLPEGLRVGGDLRIRFCPNWDGMFPEDTFVAGHVVCDTHQDGVWLETWRAERAHDPLPADQGMDPNPF